MVEDVTSLKSTEEWMTLLTNADIPCARVNRLGDLMQDPHLQSVGLFEKRTHPVEGSYWSIRHPVTYGETPASIRRDPPLLGENTQEVFRELGLNDDEIEKLLPTNT